MFDDDAGTIDVHYVDFPSEWTEVSRALEDLEYPVNSDWFSVLQSYQADALISSFPLVDGLESVSLSTDAPDELDGRQVTYDFGFQTTGNPLSQSVSATIYFHAPPVN